MICVAVYFSLPLNRFSKTHHVSNVSGRMVMIPNDEWPTVQILNPMLHPDPQKEKRLLYYN